MNSDTTLLVLNEIRALRLDIEQLRAEVKSWRSEHPLLGALHRVVGRGVSFTARELLDTTTDEVLLELIGDEAIEFGRMLARLEGRGLRRVGKDSCGVLWTLDDR
jgi:hypothetical protein